MAEIVQSVKIVKKRDMMRIFELLMIIRQKRE